MTGEEKVRIARLAYEGGHFGDLRRRWIQAGKGDVKDGIEQEMFVRALELGLDLGSDDRLAFKKHANDWPDNAVHVGIWQSLERRRGLP